MLKFLIKLSTTILLLTPLTLSAAPVLYTFSTFDLEWTEPVNPFVGSFPNISGSFRYDAEATFLGFIDDRFQYENVVTDFNATVEANSIFLSSFNARLRDEDINDFNNILFDPNVGASFSGFTVGDYELQNVSFGFAGGSEYLASSALPDELAKPEDGFGMFNIRVSEIELIFLQISTGNIIEVEANFDVLEPSPIPVPGAVWLFGSALVCLARLGLKK